MSIKQVLVFCQTIFVKINLTLYMPENTWCLKMCYLLLLTVSSMREVTMSDFVYHEIHLQGPAPGTQ